MKKRIGELTLLNVLFAMLVIFIHVSSRPLMALRQEGFSYLAVMTLWRLSSFATQGFIFLSGFKLIYNLKDKLELGKFYAGKIKRIFLPYLVWVVIYYLLFVALKFLPEQNHIPAILKHMLLGDLVGHMYFVPVIMQFYLLAPLWIFLRKKVNPAPAIIFSLLITLAFSLLPTMLKLANSAWIFKGNDRLITSYLVFFAVGIYAGGNAEEFADLVKKHFRMITVAFIAVAVVDLVMSYFCYRAIAKIYFLDQVHILYSTVAILFFYGLAGRMQQWSEKKFVRQIDGASYYIYLSHCFFIFLINHIMTYLEIYPEKFTYPIRIVVVYSVTILLCVGYTELKKMKFFHKKVE